MAQKKSVVILQRSTRSDYVKQGTEDFIKVYQGTFKQDYSIMTSDSAYFYPQRNSFDAFGNVHITQGDTLNIYADKLNYNGNNKTAILTNNVRMIDKDAILTTNYLTYNTATRIGTYLDGGKLISKDNVLTSKNGYYFARSRDAYFRYNVNLVTPDALIKTDTLRYSTATRIAYFLGPSNIYDTKDKKDTLYTENGLYNTITEQAFFGKRNVYKSGSKRLKGDSLFYDKLKGFGRGVRHVIFTDSEQKITMTGDLITYYKTDEKTVVTIDPRVIIVTEERDTTAKADSAQRADSVAKSKTTAARLPATVKGKPVSVNLPTVGSVSVSSLSKPQLNKLPKDTVVKVQASVIAQAKALNMPQLKNLPRDTSIQIRPPAGTMPVKAPALTRPKKITDSLATITPKPKTKTDSVYLSADTLETQIMTFKNYKLMLEKLRLSRIRDTTTRVKKPVANAKTSKLLTAAFTTFSTDSTMYHKDIFGKPKPVAVKAKPQRRTEPDPADNEPEIKPYNMKALADTARIRIVIAHHNAKLFKSDLQAKADSMFYSYSDSTMRCYVNPIIWTQGSQLSGDTIYMQMHNKKLDNLDMFPSALIVNVEKKDSLHFNQVAGKRMKGYFRNDKLDRMYVTGNAESIYFVRDSLAVKEMQRSLSSRMRIRFKNNSASNITFLIQPDHRYAGLGKFTEEERILKSFKWKPKERPISKESILPSYNRKRNPPPAKPAPSKRPLSPQVKAAGDSTRIKRPGTGFSAGAKTDSIALKSSLSDPANKDSAIVKPARMLPLKKDSATIKPQPVVAPRKEL